jgi:hypothetical protein
MKKIVNFLTLLALVFMVFENCKPVRNEKQVIDNQLIKQKDSIVICDTCRLIKFFFKEPPQHSSVFQINGQRFEYRQDTFVLNLKKQDLDTFTIIDKYDSTEYHSRILKLRNGFTYYWGINTCSDIDFISPTQSDTTHNRKLMKVSFTIKNYRGKDPLIGVVIGEGWGDSSSVKLRNRYKSDYAWAAVSAMCGTDAKRIAIENPKIKVKWKDSEDRFNKVIKEFWFLDMEQEQLDIFYDFKTKKMQVKVIE